MIDTLARPALPDLYSQLVATGRDKLPPATAESLPDIELEKGRLDLEERKQAEKREQESLKLAQQAELKKQKLAEQTEQKELEKLRLIEQAEQRKAEQAQAQVQTHVQADQIKLESKRVELKIERVRQQNDSAESPAALLKRYGDALRGILSRMPSDPADIPAFFDNAERVFKDTDISANYQAHLLMSYLTDKACVMVGQIDQKKATYYAEVKALLLREYKLTSWAYRKRYETVTKQTGETYVMFASRLSTMLNYYIASNNVKTFNDLKSLLIVHHIKDMLSPTCFQQVLAVENTEKEGWLAHNKLAEIIDRYIASHGFKDKPQTSVNQAYVYTPQVKPVYNQKTSFNKTQEQNKPERRCFHCDSKLHIIKDCPHYNNKKKDDGHVKTKQFTNSSQKKSAQVHTAVTVSSATAKPERKQHTKPTRDATVMHINIAPIRSSEEKVQLNNTKMRDANVQADVQIFRGTTDSIATHKNKYNITDLTYIDVQIDGLSRPVKALHDSGAMISVIHPRVIEKISPNISYDGKINLRGLFGEPVNADLVTVFVKSFNCFTDFIPVVMATTSFANTNLIFIDQVAQALLTSKDDECSSSIATDFCVHNDVITNTSYDTDTSESEDDTSTEQSPSQHKKSTQLKAVTKEQLL